MQLLTLRSFSNAVCPHRRKSRSPFRQKQQTAPCSPQNFSLCPGRSALIPPPALPPSLSAQHFLGCCLCSNQTFQETNPSASLSANLPLFDLSHIKVCVHVCSLDWCLLMSCYWVFKKQTKAEREHMMWGRLKENTWLRLPAPVFYRTNIHF